MVTKGFGLTVEDINWSCPADLEPYEHAHEKEIEEKDILNWQLGQYFASALDATVCNATFWRRKGERGHTYIEEPFSYKKPVDEANEDEIQRQRELFVAKLKIMQANFEVNNQQ